MVDTTTPQHVDVLIVGAGISGIGGACHLRQRCPDKSFLLLEGRDSFGGTWDLFRFPGIRSDSDLYTYGYNFKPWQGKPIATAAEILHYFAEPIAEYGLAERIRYGHRVRRVGWSSPDAWWTVQAAYKGATGWFTCIFCGCARGITTTSRPIPRRFP